MRTILVIFILISLSATHLVLYAADMVTVHLQHRLPEEIAELIQPLLYPEEKIVPSPNGLIVMAKPQRIREIHHLVDQLDQPYRQLTVSVIQDDKVSAEQLNAQIDIDARRQLNHPHDLHGRISGSINRSESNHSIGIQQTLNVLEGHPGFIEVGENQPVSVIESNSIYSYTRRHGYRKATTGFQLLPRLLGKCQVQVQISPWSIRATNRNGSYSMESAETTLVVKLGQWFELGSHNLDEKQRQNQLLGYQSGNRQQLSSIFLKIDTVDDCHR